MMEREKGPEMNDEYNNIEYDDDDDDYRDLPVISEEQLRAELLEARADIQAGRLVSGEALLARLDRKIEEYLKRESRRDGKAVT